MWNFNDIVLLEYKSGYVYHIRFDDGVEGDIDFSEYLKKGTVFKSFEDQNYFKSAKISGGTISWNDDLDIAPETIYMKLKVNSPN